MSTLTQFLGGAVPVGGYTIANIGNLGTNPTLDGQEYLQMGAVKAYSSPYSAIAQFKAGCSVDSTAAASTWGGSMTNGTAGNGYYWGQSRVIYAGTTYYMIGSGSATSLASYYGRYGSSLTGAGSAFGPGSDGTIFDAIASSNNTNFICNQIDTATGTSLLNMSTGGIFQTQASTGLTLQNFLLAASPTRVIAMNGAPRNVGANVEILLSTNNGVSWTGNNYTVAQNIYRFVYSPAGTSFIYYGSNTAGTSALIITSPGTDGVTTWTSRTVPTGTPTPVATSTTPAVAGYRLQSSMCATSSTVTLIWLSQGYFLRTTDAVNFTLVNINSLHPAFTGNQAVTLGYDGTRFIAIANGYGNQDQYQAGVTAYSTDGTTWTLDYRRYNSSVSECFSNNCPILGSGVANSIPYVIAAPYAAQTVSTRLFTNTGKIALSAPDYIGNAYFNGGYIPTSGGTSYGVGVMQRIL